MARKILLADDSVTAQNMGRKILADAGYEVITVNNGSAALKKIAEQKPDLIVLDVYMPGYSGLEVCQRLKETGETSRVPVLLTVGKLEPFKPEEARRARADGFIVKPFEASELLSALSKLEDKIVPRGETSKPGRFARATAAVDEGRYDKSVSVDEDSGWRNRIAFPSKKKEKVAQENGEDAGIYNAMNKDLRTVVEQKLAEQPLEAKQEEPRIDLGALAPEGLPKDVTPEEIAALAAAAAQVKGKFAESSHGESAPVDAKPAQKVDAKDQTQPAAEVPKEVAGPRSAAALVEQKSEEKSEKKTESPAERSSEASKEAAGAPAPSPADVMAAIAGLQTDAGTAAASSGNGSWSHSPADQVADEPITMAAAAGAGHSATTSRWTAVSIALAPEEAAISLEHEMQKAYAAFAAAETGHAGLLATFMESQPVPSELPTEKSSQAEAASPEFAVPASPAPEAVQTLSAVASAATEAISAAAQELEAVAASYVADKAPTPAGPEPVPVEKHAQVLEAPQKRELSTAETTHEEQAHAKKEEPVSEAPVAVASVATTEPEERSTTKTDAPDTAPASLHEIPAKQTSEAFAKMEVPAADQTPPETSAHVNPQAESEVVETTAAAWASWRRIRESGDSKDAAVEPSQDAAAMAVAAGAEKHPDESATSPESDPEGIASIVDSVLADLRPKIFEEISRKMGKKK